jgi:hypothetical protein
MAHDDHALGSSHKTSDSRGARAFGSVALLVASVHRASDVVSLTVTVGIAMLGPVPPAVGTHLVSAVLTP